MKTKSWLLSIAAAILLGGGIFGIYRYLNPSTVPPVQASVSTGEILSTILTSDTQWNTIQGEAQFTWYDNGGGKQIYSDKFVVSQPASAYIDITNLSQKGVNEGITISDGEAIYALDKAAKTYTRGSFSVKPDAVALLPRSLSQIQAGMVYAHPMAQIGVPILEYLYPSWWPQQKSGDTFVLSSTDKIVNRAVWVVDHPSTNGDRETAWVDQATGIILQFH
jgi:outer membrane lipoprotein-sorting protein